MISIESIFSILGTIFSCVLAVFIFYIVISKGDVLQPTHDNEPDFESESDEAEKDLKQEEESNRRQEQRRQAEEQKESEDDVRQQAMENRYAQVLGLKGKITKDEIKKAYHEHIAQYHPDKVQHLGVELQMLANEKTKAIVQAYEYFKNKYNL